MRLMRFLSFTEAHKPSLLSYIWFSCLDFFHSEDDGRHREESHRRERA